LEGAGVDAKSAELAQEQAYFDLAAKYREGHRDDLDGVVDATANRGAAQRAWNWVRGRKEEGARRAGRAVAHGRIDRADDTLYVGESTITDDQREVLVVNWRAPAAKPFYEATPGDPQGLTRRRAFTCDGNTIINFEDLLFAQLAEDIEALDGPDGAMLAELERGRTGAMRDIVATIRASQYRLIRAPLDQVLVIEGGPGTGKTAVALHRVSYLLFNEQLRLAGPDVLVVGPTSAFTRYIRHVLPDLGDTDVEQRHIAQLAPQVVRGRTELPPTARLKGEARMAGLLARALEARIGAPERAERLLFDGRFVTLSGVEVAGAVAEARGLPSGYAERRRLFRTRLIELAQARGAPTGVRFDSVDNLVERLWPQLSAAAFVRALFASTRRLAAAGIDFTELELSSLYRRSADRLSREVWSDADLALLDEADALINGVGRQYRHIVVDEVQDLSPMQLRAIARRSAGGSLTVVGDLTQSTGPGAHDTWDDVLRHLPSALPSNVATLKYIYRVPRLVYELAARLLPYAAPGITPGRPVRDGPAAPGIHRVDAERRAGHAVSVAVAHATAGRFVGLVCPPALRAGLEEALKANGVGWNDPDRADEATLVNVVAPHEAKGLEYDAVVVIEPEEIVASDERGHRLLFVALTRTTKYLDIVCVGEPVPVATPPQRIPVQRLTEDATVDLGQLDGMAAQVAAMVGGNTPAPLWDEVMLRAAAILDRQTGTTRSNGRHRRD
jgi:DNA helicase IV